jgi:prolyl 4-hydroxylase
LILYLNDVDQGGETIFPSIHLSVVPKKGAAIYFEYCNAAGHVDPSTLHGGAPVLAGEKWIATKWMRQRKYG